MSYHGLTILKYCCILVFTCLKVSLDPPVTALHATDEKENMEMIWCQYHDAKFHGKTI